MQHINIAKKKVEIVTQNIYRLTQNRIQRSGKQNVKDKTQKRMKEGKERIR